MNLWDLIKSLHDKDEKRAREKRVFETRLNHWIKIAEDHEKEMIRWRDISHHYEEQWRIALELIPSEVKEETIIKMKDMH